MALFVTPWIISHPRGGTTLARLGLVKTAHFCNLLADQSLVQTAQLVIDCDRPPERLGAEVEREFLSFEQVCDVEGPAVAAQQPVCRRIARRDEKRLATSRRQLAVGVREQGRAEQRTEVPQRMTEQRVQRWRNIRGERDALEIGRHFPGDV